MHRPSSSQPLLIADTILAIDTRNALDEGGDPGPVQPDL